MAVAFERRSRSGNHHTGGQRTSTTRRDGGIHQQKMSRRRSTRLKGDHSTANNEDEEDNQMTETRTPIAGSKRAPDTSLTPNRNRSTQVQKIDDLPLDETMQEGPAQITPTGAVKTGASSETQVNLSDDKWPRLSPKRGQTAGNTTKNSPLAGPPPVTHIQRSSEEAQVKVNPTPEIVLTTLPEAHQQKPPSSASAKEPAKENSQDKKADETKPHQHKAEVQEDTLTKQVQAMHVQEAQKHSFSAHFVRNSFNVGLNGRSCPYFGTFMASNVGVDSILG